MDSSGVEVTNRGELVRDLWNRKSKKGYLKIHVAVDVETKQILSMEGTDERVTDAEKFKDLVNGAKKVANVVGVLGDGAYDSKENFDFLEANGIRAGITEERLLRKSEG